MNSIQEAAEKIQKAIFALNNLNISTTPENVKALFFSFAMLEEVKDSLLSISNDMKAGDQNGYEDRSEDNVSSGNKSE